MFSILLFDIAVFLLLTKRANLIELFCITMVISVVPIVCEKPKMASRKCEKEHNQLSVKIDFMANCKKKGMTDSDSQNPDEHNCYMMRRYCAKECSENGYDGGSCDVKSLFTLNLNVDSNGNFETLDCVCIYNTPKIGCYSTYHFPWKTITKEFEQKCASNEKTTTTTKALTMRSPKILVIGGYGESMTVETTHSLEYYFPDQSENNGELSTKLGFSQGSPASFLLENKTVLIVHHLGWEIFDPASSIVSAGRHWGTKHERMVGYALLAGILYMCGGCDYRNNFTSRCERYQKGSWNADVPAMIESRCLFPMVVLGNYMYAIGGLLKVSSTETELLNDVERYDPDSNSWKKMQPMTTKRRGHAAAGFNGMIYACGGFSTDDDGKVSTSDTCEYHKPGTNKWRPMGSMTMTRVDFNLVVSTDRLFAVGPDSVEEYKDKKWSIKKKKLIKSRSNSAAVALT